MSTDEQVDTGAERNRRLDALPSAELGRPAPKGLGAQPGYMRLLEQRAPLDPREERSLVARAQAGDAAAREQLVERLLPHIAAAARAYRTTASVQRVELIQEGVLGLLRALERYDPERGVPFWAYAGWWVRQAMQQLVSELTRPLVLSDRALRHLARLKEAHGAALRETGHEPDRGDLAKRAGLTSDQVDDLMAVDSVPRSLDEPVQGEDGAVGAFGDLLADPLAEDEYERVLRTVGTEQLLALLAGLSDRERGIPRTLRARRAGAEPARDRERARAVRRARAPARAASAREARRRRGRLARLAQQGRRRERIARPDGFGRRGASLGGHGSRRASAQIEVGERGSGGERQHKSEH